MQPWTCLHHAKLIQIILNGHCENQALFCFEVSFDRNCQHGVTVPHTGKFWWVAESSFWKTTNSTSLPRQVCRRSLSASILTLFFPAHLFQVLHLLCMVACKLLAFMPMQFKALSSSGQKLKVYKQKRRSVRMWEMLGGKTLGYLQMQLLAQSFKSLKTKFGAKLALNFFLEKPWTDYVRYLCFLFF